MKTWLIVVIPVIALASSSAHGQAGTSTTHGLSAFGDLKYGPGFTRFEYVNVEAPKGGRLRLAGTDSFDTLNP